MYAENCWAMDWARFCSLFDCFAAAHLLGWFFKALLIRHHGILWTISISWEITEVGQPPVCSPSGSAQFVHVHEHHDPFVQHNVHFQHISLCLAHSHVQHNELITFSTGNDDYHSTINTPHPLNYTLSCFEHPFMFITSCCSAHFTVFSAPYIILIAYHV